MRADLPSPVSTPRSWSWSSLSLSSCRRRPASTSDNRAA